uniref:Secreted protein n=1 Tax=Oryza sativa subsp. japonica TaxID=39947 RepID=Q2RBN2_ORYSJ|nr:hypothetical protein LOC_Os11g01430 [Oryza sativa Japonica Group]
MPRHLSLPLSLSLTLLLVWWPMMGDAAATCLALVRLADTPGIKRGLESPSAWKSPWFVDMQFQGSYFVSPADRTYDALRLVKQIVIMRRLLLLWQKPC